MWGVGDGGVEGGKGGGGGGKGEGGGGGGGGGGGWGRGGVGMLTVNDGTTTAPHTYICLVYMPCKLGPLVLC